MGPHHVDAAVARKRKRELDELPHRLLESGSAPGLTGGARLP